MTALALRSEKAERGAQVKGIGRFVLVVTVVLIIWEVSARLVSAGALVLPSPATVSAQMWHDRSLYPHNLTTTATESLAGFTWGVSAATVLGVLFVQIRLLERTLMSAAIATYCLPVVAIGPILEVVTSGSTPKIMLAAIGGFFPTLIAVLLGLRAADRTSLATISAFGGGPWVQLQKVRIRSALPSFFAGLRIAGPAAVVGAIIGEYLGGNSGLGVAMVSSTQALEVPRTWGLAVVISLLAFAFYIAVSLIAARLAIVPTAPNLAAGAATEAFSGRRSLTWSVARRLLGPTVAMLVILLGWIGLLRLFHLNGYFAKTPADVYRYLRTGAHLTLVYHGLARTLHDAIPGLIIGTLAGVVLAVVFVRWAAMDRALMPLAVALQSTPTVAMTPLITLTFGRNIVGITVIVTLVTFFPTLLNVMRGLRSTPVESLDLVIAFGGSSVTCLRKVQAQCALPALFASLKIAVPGAVFGTMLAEFLSTGTGLGYAIVRASTNARFAEVWADVAVITAATLVLYGIVGLLESLALRRYAPDALGN